MNETLYRKWLRRNFRPVGWALTIYLLLLELMVQLSEEMAGLAYYVRSGGWWDAGVYQAMLDDAWGYFAAAAVGLVILWGWKGPEFWRDRIWSRGRPMTAGRLIALLGVFMAIQILGSYLSEMVNLLLSPLDMDANAFYEYAEESTDSFSMFLYGCLLAPVAEELVFRGYVQKSLEPFGKKLAIFGSALFFGMYHGNLSQAIFAFFVGLLLGYVASEYSIAWAMALHMLNNLFIADMLPRLAMFAPEEYAGWIADGPFYALALIGVWYLFRNRGRILRWQRENPFDRITMECFFLNTGTLSFLILCSIDIVRSLIEY